jgi:3-oxoacyl-[acyl-carrier-protein] synthase-3
MSYSQFNTIAISGIASAVPKNNYVINEQQNVRHSVDLQTASDLGFEAANHLLAKKNIDVTQIGFIVFISKTPDYRSPATAIVLQHRLQLSIDCLAYDVNIGSVGFAVGLQLGCSLLNNLNTSIGLIIIGDTNSKQINKDDINSIILGDAATAILLEKKETALPILIQQFSDGNGYDSYIVPQGAFRTTKERPNVELSSNQTEGSSNALLFDKQRIHDFYCSKIPQSIAEFLTASKSSLADYDSVVFQQSSTETLQEIAAKLGINFSEVASNFKDFGDVSGASVALLLNPNQNTQRVLSCSFGEGFSWAIADFYIEKDTVLPIIETDNYFREGFVTHEM